MSDSETRYSCVKCGKLLFVLAKGSKYRGDAAAVCVSCLKAIKDSVGKSPLGPFESFFRNGG
jgi:hypothetical protein